MYRLFKNAREPMSSYTHFLGMIFSTAATIFLVLLNTINGDFFGTNAGIHSGLWILHACVIQCKFHLSFLQWPSV